MADELLRALGKQQSRDPSGGSAMTPDETEALLRPFEGDEREALLDRVMERLDRGPEKETPEEAPPVVDLQSRRGRSPAVFVLAIAVAIAAALLLWFVVRPAESPGPQVAALPEYEFTQLRGGIAEKRGDEIPEVLKLRADDPIDWVVTPAKPVRGELEVGLLVSRDEGDGQLVSLPKAAVSSSGAVRITGRLSDAVALDPGEWTLTVLIAPRGELPPDAASAHADGRWQKATVRATIVAP